MRFCTIAATNYLAQVRVLRDSLRRHGHDGDLIVLWLDAAPQNEPGIEAITLMDLYGRPELDERLALYDLLELATSAKADLLSLLVATVGQVAYLDPDIEVFGSLEWLGPLASEHGTLVTPHTLAEYPRDGRTPNEQTLRYGGVFNLGFVAVGPRSRPFLDWWSRGLRWDCLNDVHRGYFVDQRFVDFLPAMFEEHLILRHPGLNVAYWNVPPRVLDTDPSGGFVVDGEPLLFFHFSGYSPDTPDRFTRHFDINPRLSSLQEMPVVAELCSRYGGLLLEAGYRHAATTRPDLGTSEIEWPLPTVVRRVYRAGLVRAQWSASSPPPNPLHDRPAFESWRRSSEGLAASRYGDLAPAGMTAMTPELWGVAGVVARHPGLASSLATVGGFAYRAGRRFRRGRRNGSGTARSER